MEIFDQMSDFFNHPNKTRNFKLCLAIILFYSSEEPKKEEDMLNRASAWPTPIRQSFISSHIKYHYSKAKYFESIQVYLQCLVIVVVDKGRKVA